MLSLLTSFGAIGALEESLSITRDYALQRIQFGKPLAAFQLVQKKLADASMEATSEWQNFVHVRQGAHANVAQLVLRLVFSSDD